MPFLPERYNSNQIIAQDRGYQETEDVLFQMTAEIDSIYGQAYRELLEQAETHLRWFRAEDEKRRQMVADGKLSEEDYQIWRRNQLMTGRNNYAMVQTMADTLTAHNVVAASVINGYLPEVYAINGDYATYEVEHHFGINTMFTLYDEQTVQRLIREKPDLLPKAKVDIPKDQRWNKEKLNAAVIQSVIQGDSVNKLAERLAAVTDMNRTSALRNAATMTTSAQNGGRMDGIKRANSMGIKCKMQWVSTLDGHTRPSHIQCDGEIRECGKTFSNGLQYPGDPAGAPEEIYNCRCVIIAAFDDQKHDISERNNRLERLEPMSYSEWKESKSDRGKPLFKAAKNANLDLKMHEEYISLLGSKVPKNFDDFQKLKYTNNNSWKKLVSEARKARNKQRNRR